ncbi:hypothetical protein MK079_00610 [Candidatus Gracilibacteria bacterium]|nr:hypothetical protein [Candidatus Gracilibacteria bacterium]
MRANQLNTPTSLKEGQQKMGPLISSLSPEEFKNINLDAILEAGSVPVFQGTPTLSTRDLADSTYDMRDIH